MSEKATHNQEYSTSSPGAILKRCREYHGISLEEAAEATKIGINYLQALEADQIKDFASLAYLKGFLRIYASHLGLNADDMMRLYEKMSAPAAPKKGPEPQSSADGGPMRQSRFSWRKLALPVCLLLLLIVTSMIMNRSQSSAPKAVPQNIAKTAPAPIQQPVSTARGAVAPAKESGAVATDTQIKEENPPERPTVQKPPIEATKGFIARMKVTHNGTLTVTIDGAGPQNYDLVVGDVIEWKADRSIIFELSNAGGVEVDLNGKPLKPFGPEGKPAYITLDAEGIKS